MQKFGALILASCLLGWSIAAGEERIVLGTVMDQGGVGVPDATVTLTDREASVSVLTDEEGNYRISSPHQGIFQLTVERTGFERALVEGVVIGSKTIRIDLVLKRLDFIENLLDLGQPKHISPIKEATAGGHATSGASVPTHLNHEPDRPELRGQIVSGIEFEEMPVLMGKTFCGGSSKDHILESGGSGVAIFDFDNDGLLDIYIVNAFELTAGREPVPHPNALYRNLGNWRFEDVAKKAGVDASSWGQGICVGDYNNDGYLDLYVTNFGPNFLFRNNGDGTFTDVAREAEVDCPGWSTGCSFFDADGDGNLDLYVANYVRTDWDSLFRAERTLVWRGGPRVMVGPVGLPGAKDCFYRNNGEGSFVEVAESCGLDDTNKYYGFGVLTTDYDDDGWIDVYVANDSNPNFLFRNLGRGHFKEIGLTSGVAFSESGRAQAGMGVDSGDFDGDGLLDIVVTNFALDRNTLHKNLGGGLFEARPQEPTFWPLGWGIAFLDADLDGDLDLFVANGHIYPQVDEYPELKETFSQKNQILLNSQGKFSDVSGSAGTGLQVAKSSRGLAIGDLDNDGLLDLVITNMDDVPTVLRNRTKTENNWIAFTLRKEGRNPFCIGAKVTIDDGTRRQSREVRSGSSYLSQSDLRVYFGLGSHAGTVDVEVKLNKNRWKWKRVSTRRLASLLLTDKREVKGW